MEFLEKNYDVLNIYSYGSRVYGTNSNDSDFDFIAVVRGLEILKEELQFEDKNVTVYDQINFATLIKQQEISVLECLSLPDQLILKNDCFFSWKINLQKLRESISAKSSNSWVKAKKKLTVKKDFNQYIAKKSLFHSLRILTFGIQLAKYDRIVDFSEANHYWEEIKAIDSIDWNVFKESYQPVYNKLKSDFRILAN